MDSLEPTSMNYRYSKTSEFTYLPIVMSLHFTERDSIRFALVLNFTKNFTFCHVSIVEKRGTMEKTRGERYTML